MGSKTSKNGHDGTGTSGATLNFKTLNGKSETKVT